MKKDSMKTTQLQLRVEPEFRDKFRRACDAFGWSLTSMFLAGACRQITWLYDKAFEQIRRDIDGMDPGIERDASMVVLEREKKDRNYFYKKYAAAMIGNDIFLDIEQLETYRDFLREVMNEEIEERAEA